MFQSILQCTCCQRSASSVSSPPPPVYAVRAHVWTGSDDVPGVASVKSNSSNESLQRSGKSSISLQEAMMLVAYSAQANPSSDAQLDCETARGEGNLNSARSESNLDSARHSSSSALSLGPLSLTVGGDSSSGTNERAWPDERDAAEVTENGLAITLTRDDISSDSDQDELPQVGSPTMIDVEAKMNQAQLTVAASLEARSAQFQQLYAEALDQQLQQHAEQEAMHQVQVLTPDGAIITVRTDISSDSDELHDDTHDSSPLHHAPLPDLTIAAPLDPIIPARSLTPPSSPESPSSTDSPPPPPFARRAPKASFVNPDVWSDDVPALVPDVPLSPLEVDTPSQLVALITNTDSDSEDSESHPIAAAQSPLAARIAAQMASQRSISLPVQDSTASVQQAPVPAPVAVDVETDSESDEHSTAATPLSKWL